MSAARRDPRSRPPGDRQQPRRERHPSDRRGLRGGLKPKRRDGGTAQGESQPAQRAALLDEFEKSGASGMKFARMVGVKYSTFANWVKQRRERAVATRLTVCAASKAGGANGKAAPVRLFEALVEGVSREPAAATAVDGLLIEWPGGSRLRIESPVQLQMAAELVALIAQRARSRC